MTTNNTPSTPYNDIQQHIATLQGIFDIMGSAASDNATKLSREAIAQIISSASPLLERLTNAADTLYSDYQTLEQTSKEQADSHPHPVLAEYAGKKVNHIKLLNRLEAICEAMVQMRAFSDIYNAGESRKVIMSNVATYAVEAAEAAGHTLSHFNGSLIPSELCSAIYEARRPDVIDIMTAKQKQAA